MSEKNQYQYPEDATARPDSVTGGPSGHHKDKGQIWKYVLTALVSVFLTFTLTAGTGILLYLGFSESDSPVSSDKLTMSFADDTATRTALNKLQTVFQAVNENYYDDLSDAEMLEAMTKGLVNEIGNPYTMYLSAEQNAQIAESMSGSYSGVGAIVAMNPDGIAEITELVENSPALESGLQVGDLFMQVDGEDVTTVQDVNALAILVRGKEGTTVDLEIYRPSTQETLTITVERRSITSASVSYHMLNDTIGYVRVSEFSQGVAENFIKAVDALQAEGARNIVFDLRNNSGGLASEVITMLDYLLPEAVIASIEGRNDGEPYQESWQSEASMGVPESMQYAILINGFTASASELFSGCLRDHDKALLIGEQSYGKGSGTNTYNLDDGSAITVTNFLYYLPSGESIEGVGLTPDHLVDLPESAVGKSVTQLSPAEDTQLSDAISYLQGLS